MIKVEIDSTLWQEINNERLISEIRNQTNYIQGVVVNNGRLISDSKLITKGISIRVAENGYIGFASSPLDNSRIRKLITEANNNLSIMERRFGSKNIKTYNRKSQPIEQQYYYICDSLCKQLDCQALREYAIKIDTYLKHNCKGLVQQNISICEMGYDKELAVTGTAYMKKSHNTILISITMLAQRQEGSYVRMSDTYALEEDLTDFNFEKINAFIDTMYQHILEKKQCIQVENGLKTIVLSSKMTSIITHEAVGHIAEADNVRADSIAVSYLNKMVASDLINITDFANNYNKKLLPVEIYIDDEGTLAKNVEIIKEGYFRGLMTDLKTSNDYDIQASGNARAMYYYDLPMVRMRNTAMLPGEDNEADIIESTKDGYYLISGNEGKSSLSGNFSLTSEFGYEIKNGKLGRPIGNTRLSGNCFDLLSSVDMVSNRIEWYFGLCTKEQKIPVSNGGPVIRCKANVGRV